MRSTLCLRSFSNIAFETVPVFVWSMMPPTPTPAPPPLLMAPVCLCVQFKMVSIRSEKPMCALPCFSDVCPSLPLKQFQCSSDWQGPPSPPPTRPPSLLPLIISCNVPVCLPNDCGIHGDVSGSRAAWGRGGHGHQRHWPPHQQHRWCPWDGQAGQVPSTGK